VAYTGDQLVPETFQSTEGDPADDYVGPKNIPGYDRVASRSPGHLEEVLRCPDLSPGISDHCPLEKHKRISQTTYCLFFPSSTTTVVPRIESTKRCFLGQNSGPASWPDCNRYVEAVIIKSCQIYPSQMKINGNTTLLWTLVEMPIKNIRKGVINNAHVIQQTGIQLAAINQRTLIQW